MRWSTVWPNCCFFVFGFFGSTFIFCRVAERVLSVAGFVPARSVAAVSREEYLSAVAEAAGYPTLDGRPMVLNQAIEAFAIVNAKILLKKGMDRAEIVRTMKSVFKP